MTDVNNALEIAVKTGKVLIGAKKALESAKFGRAKMIVVASNCPKETFKSINYYCELSRVPVYIYEGTSIDLGAVCSKPYTVSAVTIREVGDSDILRLEKTKAASTRYDLTLEGSDA